jgi:hypothetical protein
MYRFVALAGIILIAFAAPLPAQQPTVRTQETNGRTYFQIRLPAPNDSRIPRSQRQSIEKIALHDLGRYPRLISLDSISRSIAWYVSKDAKTLEFLGVVPAGSAGKFKLIYPTETEDKPPQAAWKEIELSIDWANAVKVDAPKTARALSPADDDLEGRWASAWARELAIREQQSSGALPLRLARQELCRQFHVADPMPRASLTTPGAPPTRDIDIKEITPLEPMRYAWNELLAGREIAVEAVSRILPADFYYLRIRDDSGAKLLNQIRRWAKLAVALWDGTGRDVRIVERYLRQLALPVDEHGDFRLPRGVREAAITGSDWHFRMGADVTVVYSIQDPNTFRAEMDHALEQMRREFAAMLVQRKESYREFEIQIFETPSGEVRLHRVTLNDFVICSNSSAAIHRIIDTIRGQSPSIADAPEFRLLRTAFQPSALFESGLLFVPEAFLLQQLGPRRQILARRLVAELEQKQITRSTALFTAWNGGQSPKLPGEEFSVPLIERQIDKISHDEDDFYQQFRERYRSEFSQFMAPFGVRLSAISSGVGVEAFVMSSRDADFWDGLRRHLGKGSVARESGKFPGTFARVVASVRMGEMDNARFKNTLIKLGVDRKRLTEHFDWMGDGWKVHLSDGSALSRYIENELHVDLTAADLAISHDKRDERWLLAQLPVTLAIDIAKTLFFEGTIKRAKQIVAESFPKGLTWETLPEKFQGKNLNRVLPTSAISLVAFGKLLKPEESPGVFYANDGNVVVLAPSLETLKVGLVRELFPNRAREPQRERANAWLTVNLAESPQASQALRQFLHRDSHRQALAAVALWQWLHDCGALSGKESRAQREAIAKRWLGFVPASFDQSEVRWDSDRHEVVNVVHGSSRHPALSADPNPMAPWLRTLTEFARVRGRMDIRPDGVLGAMAIERTK